MLVIGAGPAGLAAALAGGARRRARDPLRGGFRARRPAARRARARSTAAGARLGGGGRGRAREPARRAAHAAHHRVRRLRRRHLRRGRARRRSSARRRRSISRASALWRIVAKRAVLAAGAIERPHRVRRQRPARGHAGSAPCAPMSTASASRRAPRRRLHHQRRRLAHRRTILPRRRRGRGRGRCPRRRRTRPLAAQGRGARIFAGAVVDRDARRSRRRAASIVRDARRRVEHASPAISLAVSGGWNPTLASDLPSRRQAGAGTSARRLRAGRTAAGHERSPARPPGASRLADALHGRRAAGAGGGRRSAASTRTPPASRARRATRAAARHAALARARRDAARPSSTSRTTSPPTDSSSPCARASARSSISSATPRSAWRPTRARPRTSTASRMMAELTGTHDPGDRHHDLPPALHAGADRRARRPPSRQGTSGRRGCTPSHDWAQEQGAVFVEAGLWLRRAVVSRGRARRLAADRQPRGRDGARRRRRLRRLDARQDRRPGAPTRGSFLDRVYANSFSTLPVGKARYGLMLREDGFVIDDGTTARLGEDHFLMTTTTANAGEGHAASRVLPSGAVARARRRRWSRSPSNGRSIAVAGPRSRDVLQASSTRRTTSPTRPFPYLGVRRGHASAAASRRGCSASRSRASSPMSSPCRRAMAMPASRAVMAAGDAFGVAPYGTEALGVLRIEKGHVGRQRAQRPDDGARSRPRPHDVDRRRISSAASWPSARRSSTPDRPSARRVPARRPHRAAARGRAFPRRLARRRRAEHDEGYMTSVAFSPTLGHWIGLGLLRARAGADRRARAGLRPRARRRRRGRDLHARSSSTRRESGSVAKPPASTAGWLRQSAWAGLLPAGRTGRAVGPPGVTVSPRDLGLATVMARNGALAELAPAAVGLPWHRPAGRRSRRRRRLVPRLGRAGAVACGFP